MRLNIAQLYLPERFRDESGKIDYDKLFAQADEIRKRYAANPLTRADAVKIFADGVPEANPNNVPPTLGNSPRPTPYLQPIFAKDANGGAFGEGLCRSGFAGLRVCAGEAGGVCLGLGGGGVSAAVRLSPGAVRDLVWRAGTCAGDF